MNGRNINFNNDKIKKSNTYNKNKKTFNIDDTDVNKISISKNETYGEHNSFKYLLGIMIMMLLDIIFIYFTNDWLY